jgi:phage terminase large subunit-like protein
MNNYELIAKLKAQSKSSLFAKYEAEYRGKVSDAEFYAGCIELAPYSFLAFVSACLKERFDLQPFHRLIAEIFEYCQKPSSDVLRFIISCPPRAGKSMLIQYYMAWLCGLNPRTANLFGSYGQRLSSKFLSAVALTMQSAEYQACFPNFPGFMTGSNTLFKTGGSIFSTSVGGALTGISGGSLDIIEKVSPGIAVMDDSIKSSDSKADLEALPSFWVDEWNTRRTGSWLQAVIGTRFAVNDLHAIVLNLDGLWDSKSNPTGWLFCNLPALCKDPKTDLLNREYNESLWETHPTLNTAELLKLEKKNLWRFNNLYQGNPSIPEGTLVKKSVLANPQNVVLSEVTDVVLAIDSASGSTAQCDNTSLTVGGIWNSVPIILEQVSGNWPITELRVEIAKLIAKWKPTKIGIENASTGLALIPDMLANTNNCNPDKLPIEKLSPQLMGGKIRRLQSIEELIPITVFSNAWAQVGSYDAFIEEILSFPNGEKDDRVDSFVWCLIMLKALLGNKKEPGTEFPDPEAFDEAIIF